MNLHPMGWDGISVHRQLGRLTLQRAVFRARRTLNRLRSPRRIIATTLAVGCFLAYVFNAIFVLSARQAAAPERLRLWLSGGMVIYAVYHLVRCAWTSRIADLELTESEKLWLGGAPLRRSSLAVYHIGNVLLASLTKTLLLAVLLVFDVNHFELLVVGIFAALLLLELTRLITQRWSAALDRRRQYQIRMAVTAVAVCLALQVLAHVAATTPLGSPTWKYVPSTLQALGQTASCSMVQWLSFPWIASAELAVTEHYSLATMLIALGSVASIPVAVTLLVFIDDWASRRRLSHEQDRLAGGEYQKSRQQQSAAAEDLDTTAWLSNWLERVLPDSWRSVSAVITRQSVSVGRYWGTIAFSFVVPLLLCLSPLATGQVTEQWMFVVGGVALCTILLAPPALRLDFRRDLRRMILLRSLPVRPMQMVVGQLTIPIIITLAFQWTTLLIAALVTHPGWIQIILWTGMLNALAVFTFATENALFLAYPHHERAEGIAMMIRTKLTFLGKGTVIATSIAALLIWGIICRKLLPVGLSRYAYVGGAVAATWCFAILAVFAASWCWRRFDLAYDVPPE